MTYAESPFAAETIHYGFRETGVGLAVIAASARGVAAILFGSSRDDLRHKLAEALAGANLEEDEAGLGTTLDTVSQHLDEPAGASGFRLDLRGGSDEMAVWQALRAVPVGETRTYGEIAKLPGVRLTAQEVGAACAANRLAVAIPCHRVLKADGSISGYRWGVFRKRRLLAMERAA